jgi:hypothetical protein
MMSCPVKDLSRIVLEQFQIIAGSFKAADMENILATSRIGRFQNLNRTRLNITTITGHIYPAVLNLLGTEINSLNARFLNDASSQNSNITSNDI